MDIYERLKELQLELPPAPERGGMYQPVLVIDGMAYVSGQGSAVRDGKAVKGKLGTEITVEEGRAAARICALNALSALHANLGDLNRIERLVKTLGFVSSSNDFCMQPAVVDGASCLLAEIFGEEKGTGARSAIAANVLPLNLCVEIEFLFKLK